MADLVPAASYTSITGVGTTVLTTGDGHALYRVVIPGTYVGTVAVYDSATAAGTTAGNLILSFGLPTTSIPTSVDVGARVRSGITFAATGTPVLTLVWS